MLSAASETGGASQLSRKPAALHEAIEGTHTQECKFSSRLPARRAIELIVQEAVSQISTQE